MKVHVKPLRQRGALISERQIQAMTAAEGGLSIYRVGTKIYLRRAVRRTRSAVCSSKMETRMKYAEEEMVTIIAS